MPIQRPKYSPQQPQTSSLSTFYLLSIAISTYGLLTAYLHQNPLPLYLYITCSVLSFITYAYDKYRATYAGWRVRENLLHILDALGGWPGGLLAQRYFRHKTGKMGFQVVFRGIVLVHLGFWLRWLFGWGKSGN